MAKSPRFISKLSLITFHNILNKNCCSFESLRTIKSQTWFNHGINTDNGKYGTKLINETIVASLAVSGVNRLSKIQMDGCQNWSWFYQQDQVNIFYDFL